MSHHIVAIVISLLQISASLWSIDIFLIFLPLGLDWKVVSHIFWENQYFSFSIFVNFDILYKRFLHFYLFYFISYWINMNCHTILIFCLWIFVKDSCVFYLVFFSHSNPLRLFSFVVSCLLLFICSINDMLCQSSPTVTDDQLNCRVGGRCHGYFPRWWHDSRCWAPPGSQQRLSGENPQCYQQQEGKNILKYIRASSGSSQVWTAREIVLKGVFQTIGVTSECNLIWDLIREYQPRIREICTPASFSHSPVSLQGQGEKHLWRSQHKDRDPLYRTINLSTSHITNTITKGLFNI